MREINGTVTLAFVEEDNKQRVIFRVFPLCTREGGVFNGGSEDFPDEGSMRIVPDKREQSTFKDRMRSIGGLCAIYLINGEGKELIKVRQNRNYMPEQGEKNKLAIYSDVICEFADEGCFEVLNMGADASGALTEEVLLHKNKVLYGPVKREDAATVDESTLHPFGNDRFLLHTIEVPALGKRQIYWDPEAILNWRQRRNAIRHREKAEEASGRAGEKTDDAKATPVEKPAVGGRVKREQVKAEEKPAVLAVRERQAALSAPETLMALETPEQVEAPKASVETPKPEAPKPQPQVETPKPQVEAPKAQVQTKPEPQAPAPEVSEPQAEQTNAPAPIKEEALSNGQPHEMPERKGRRRNADKAQPAAQPESENAALPIGTKLDILDAELTFDQQLSRLDQSLSTAANRLSTEAETVEEPEEEPEEVSAHFSGTPLMQSVKPVARSVSRPESVHHVVERQLIQRAENDENGGIPGLTENPIDNLKMCLDYIWQNVDMRRQAMDTLGENEAFMRDMLQAFRCRGMNTHATAAAQEQLSEIEAERLSLLMQLENAKNNEKKYREEAIAGLSQKLRAESERLKQEIKGLKSTKEQLTASMQTMSTASANQMVEFMSKNIQCLSGASEDRILLSPVIGQHYTAGELAEKLRVHMNDSGYGLNEDDAMSLLINFSVCDSVCLRSKTEADAARFAQIMLESFGLQSVSGRIQPNAFVEVISLLPEDGKRTPTVTVQAFGTESMSIYGHKTVYLLQPNQTASLEEALAAYPVIEVQAATRRAFGRTEEWTAVQPASLSSFIDIRADVHPMQDEAQKWFEELKNTLDQSELALSQTMLIDMSRFIEVASHKVRGGFLSAADAAVCRWVMPTILLHRTDPSKLIATLTGLPRALEMLHL